MYIISACSTIITNVSAPFAYRSKTTFITKISSLLLSSGQVPSMQNTTLTPEEIDVANQIDRYFRYELIYKRNRRMAMRVKAILEAKPKQSFFFALGTGKFLDQNLLL